MRLRALVLLMLLAGCTAPAPIADEPAPAQRAHAPLHDPVLLLAPPRSAAPALPVEVDVSERWLKPLRGTDARVTAPPGAHVAWFVELAEEEPRATVIDGDIFVLKASTPDHHNTAGPRQPVRVAEMAPDGRARIADFATAGRHTLAAEGASLVVNVWPGAPAGGTQAFLVEDAEGLRFEPRELDVAPGTRVLLWSQLSRSVEVRETGYAAHVPLAASGGHLVAIDEGLYRLIALAVREGARGVGRASFLVDFERPSDRLEVGPIDGSFTAPGGGIEEPRRVGFQADHPLRALVVRVEARSAAPLPASVVVRLLQDGQTLGEVSSRDGGELTLEALPGGRYALEIAGEQGVSVAYLVRAEGRYSLPTPARLYETTT